MDNMIVTVMRNDGKSSTKYIGLVKVTKNFDGTQWLIIRILSDEEKTRTGKDYHCDQYPVNEYYIILN